MGKCVNQIHFCEKMAGIKIFNKSAMFLYNI